jgi:hypothetical protein
MIFGAHLVLYSTDADPIVDFSVKRSAFDRSTLAADG